jgi:hypothetical protein
MAIRIYLTLCQIAFVFASGIAFAEQPGSTTGPAAGGNVEPSTTIQKENSGASGAPAAAGSPGVEAKPGSEGGKAPEARPGMEGGAKSGN